MGAHRPPDGRSPDGRPSDPAGGRFRGAQRAAGRAADGRPKKRPPGASENAHRAPPKMPDGRLRKLPDGRHPRRPPGATRRRPAGRFTSPKNARRLPQGPPCGRLGCKKVAAVSGLTPAKRYYCQAELSLHASASEANLTLPVNCQ